LTHHLSLPAGISNLKGSIFRPFPYIKTTGGFSLGFPVLIKKKTDKMWKTMQICKDGLLSLKTVPFTSRKNLSFYFSLYFEGSPPAEDPRELCGGGDPPMSLGFYVPMERFFDGMDQETSKAQGKGQIRNFFLNKKERMEERKRKDF
jgi:hypothetical protein